MSEPVLAARGLSLRFGSIRALDDVSFAVHADELLSIIGPNGAGKSSLLNCLSGFYRPQAGSVHFLGRDVTRLPVHRYAALGVGRTFQGIQTYASMTVRENILCGFHTRMRRGLFAGLLYWGPARREEDAFVREAVHRDRRADVAERERVAGEEGHLREPRGEHVERDLRRLARGLGLRRSGLPEEGRVGRQEIVVADAVPVARDALPILGQELARPALLEQLDDRGRLEERPLVGLERRHLPEGRDREVLGPLQRAGAQLDR